MDAVLEAIPDTLYHIDNDGLLLGYKSGIGKLYTQLAAGQNMLDTVPHDLRKMTQDAMQLARETRETQVFTYQISIDDKVSNILSHALFQMERMSFSAWFVISPNTAKSHKRLWKVNVASVR